MIYLTRHGQPVSRREDEPGEPAYPPADPHLTELGRLQARLLGERLSREAGLRRIYASPYRRTMETAQLIAEATGLEIYPEPALRELTGPGIDQLRGLTLDELQNHYPAVAREACLIYPWWTLKLEPVDDRGQRPAVIARMANFIRRLPKEPGEDFLLVGHGASQGAAIDYLSTLIPDKEQLPRSPDWNCAITAFQPGKSAKFTLLRDTAHLKPEQTTNNRLTFEETWKTFS